MKNTHLTYIGAKNAKATLRKGSGCFPSRLGISYMRLRTYSSSLLIQRLNHMQFYFDNSLSEKFKKKLKHEILTIKYIQNERSETKNFRKTIR